MQSTITSDIAIVGAGVAGCIAAIALAPHFSVVLIDQNATPPMRIGECLPAAAQRILSQLNILESFEQQAHLCSQGMESYWGSKHKLVSDNIKNPDGFGWYLSRPNFEALLRKTALSRGVKCRWPSKLIDSKPVNQHWQLFTDVGESISAKLVIDAGGRQSPFVRQLKIHRQQQDKLVSYWFTVPDASENRMALISASEQGWWYSAPVPDNNRVVAFQTDSDLFPANARRCITPLMHQAMLNSEISALLANKSAGSIQYHGVTTANSSRLVSAAGSNWAALGDAAISFDPLSSQGMYNAMASAMQLANLLIENQSFDQQYNRQMDNIWHAYLQHKNLYYAQETRWKQSLFWQRRNQRL